jgi:UDP:flavonoid glycosyltransferase YjiC (YdhE family)
VAQLKFDMKHLFIDAGPRQLQDVEALARDWKPDVVLAEPGFVGGAFLHEKTRVPAVLLNVLPMGLSSRDAAPFGLALPPKPGVLGVLRNGALNWAVPNVIFRDVQKHWNKVRASVGLPKAGWVLDFGKNLSAYLQPTVPGLEYPRDDLPENVRFIGLLPIEPPAEIARPAWWSELDGSKPIVHVTQGTIANQSPDLFAPALAGLAEENVLVVVTTGGRTPEELGLCDVPKNVRIGSFLPYAELLPKTRVMVTNGGYGGVQLALAAGVPLVVAGGSEDKPEIAARVAHAGAGIDLQTGKPSAQQLRDAVRKVLSEPRWRERAAQLKAEFARYDSVDLAVDAIEAQLL